ncbi:MAG: NPCBM/NEW2 domain-containing protein [Clostridia bacterium]|nr:NPCBM/NEW2 domain-containing protein [Clostridia bacterium]
MKLLKRFFILLFSFSLIVTSGILISQFIPKQNRVSAASSYKYFYLSNMAFSNSANANYGINVDYITLKRGPKKVEETFVKNITFTANNTITYNLKGLNATRFSAIIGVENGSATFTVTGDGTTLLSATTLNSDSQYGFVDVDVTNVKNLVLQVSNSSSTRATFANPRLFGSNLLVGTEGTAIDLSYLPYYTHEDAQWTYPQNLPSNSSITLNPNDNKGITIPVHDDSSNPAKVGWGIEGIGVFRFVSTVNGNGNSNTFQVRIRRTGEDEILKTITTSGTAEIEVEIPADATFIVLAAYGSGSATYLNPKLYCYFKSITELSAESFTPAVTDPSSGDYNQDWNQLKINSVPDGNKATLSTQEVFFDKSLFHNAPSSIVYNVTNTHLTRFTSFVGIVSNKFSDGCDGVNFKLVATTILNEIESTETLRYIENIQYNVATLHYIDVNIPVGTIKLSFIVEARNNNWSDHAIWCAPMMFGNRLDSYNTAPSKLESNSTSHFREGTSYTENHNYSVKVITPSTCTTKGTATYTCTVCDYSETRQDLAINSNNHTGEVINGGTASVHTKYSCCGAVVSSTHNYTSNITTQPTCTKTGVKTYTCSCGYSYTETVSALGHSWGNWAILNDTTHQRTCSVCKVTEQENHSVGGWISTDPNQHYKYCSVCNSNVNSSTHNYDHACDTTCNTCNYTREIEHDWENEYTADEFFHWYECSVCGEKKNEEVHLYDYNSDKECNICGHVRTLEIKNSASLSLKGEISLNLYVDATKYTSDTEAYVKLTYNHNKTGYTPRVSTDTIYLKTLEPEDDDTYKFSVSFASGQIAENVKIELYDSQQVKWLEFNYSVLTYCESVINNQSQQDNLKNLCKAIINYGIRSIENFNYSVSLAKDTNEYLQTIENAPEQAPTVNNEVITGSIATLQHYKYSLVALSEVSIRLYFKLDYGQNFADYIITLTKPTGSEMNFITGANNYGHYVEVFGIESANIDSVFTVNITYQTESLSITYSALDYISDKLTEQNLSSTTQNLCMAIYHYNHYANIYFNK